jgi:hypothetical protein
MSSESGPNLVTNGLVLCLDAANPLSYKSGATIWNDLTYNTSGGTLTNGPTFSSTNGGSIVFDGVDDYVDLGIKTLGNILNGTSGITISSWIKISNLTSERAIFFMGINGTSTLATIQVFNNSLRIGGRSVSSDSFQNTTYDYTQTNIWIYITGILNYGTSKLIIYVNGSQVQESSATFNSTTLSVGTPTIVDSIGGYNNSLFYSGNVSQTVVYNRALSAQEVLQNYNATKSRFGL